MPAARHETISLIGMPGAGKSTVGAALAALCGLSLRDTDHDIEAHEGEILQAIVDRIGTPRFRELEEAVLLTVPLEGAVIATGGSVVYSPAVMARLHAAGPVVYLAADLETLEARIATRPLRGIARRADQSFADVFAERAPLYERYADITVDAAAGSAEAVATQVHAALG